MYLLDTCVISEAHREASVAVDWIHQAPRGSVFLSAITIGEVAKGVTMLARRDSKRAARLQRWLDQLCIAYASQILPVDETVATAWGRLMGERSRPTGDMLIAATAKVHGKVLVTRNDRDFADTGIQIINPWAP